MEGWVGRQQSKGKKGGKMMVMRKASQEGEEWEKIAARLRKRRDGY